MNTFSFLPFANCTYKHKEKEMSSRPVIYTTNGDGINPIQQQTVPTTSTTVLPVLAASNSPSSSMSSQTEVLPLMKQPKTSISHPIK